MITPRDVVEYEIRFWRRHIRVGWVLFALQTVVAAVMFAFAAHELLVKGVWWTALIQAALGVLNAHGAQDTMNNAQPRNRKALQLWLDERKKFQNPLDN